MNTSSTAHSGTHADECIIFERARVEGGIWTDVTILSNINSVAGLASIATDTCQILNSRVLANVDLGGVSTDNDAVPYRGSFSKTYISDNCSIRSDPITLLKELNQDIINKYTLKTIDTYVEETRELRVRNGNTAKRRYEGILMSSRSLIYHASSKEILAPATEVRSEPNRHVF